MRILVVGAGGHVGGAVLQSLASRSDVSGLVAADRDNEACRANAAMIDGVVVDEVDAADRESVRQLIDRNSVGLVVNAAGPYSATLIPVLGAAISMGVGYVDVAEGASDIGEGLKLGGEATETGVVCLLGAGAFPGLTNHLVLTAASRLDSVSDAAVALAISAAAVVPDEETIGAMVETGRVSAGWRSMIEGAARPARVYESGQRVELPVGSSRHFDAPSGHPVILAHHDHSEPLTLPRFLPSLANAVTCLGFVPAEADEIFRHSADAVAEGASSTEAALRFFRAVDGQRQRLSPPTGLPPAQIWAEVKGVSNGQPITATSWPNGTWATTTAILTAAVASIVEGHLNTPGVHTIETLNSETLLSLAAGKPYTTLDELLQFDKRTL